MADMITKGNQDAKHRLKDLEVREVSVVDRPANQRRFLIVKRSTEASEMDEVTIDLSVLDDAEQLLDLLALDNEATPVEVVSDLGGLEAIFKASTAGQAVKQLAPMLQKLLDAVSALKKLGSGEAPPALVAQIKGVIGALNLLAGQAKSAAQKLDGSQLSQATKALEKMVALVNALKTTDAGADIDSKQAAEMGSIASMLTGLVGAEKTPPSPRQDDKEPPPDKEATEKADDPNDPIIVLKAGAKMKKVRLNAFKRAVETLATLLKELGGEQEEEEGKMKKTPAKKADDMPLGPNPALVAQIAKLAETVDKLTETVATQTVELSKMDELNKRVEGIEGLRPTGSDDDPPVDSIKKKGGIWGGLNLR